MVTMAERLDAGARAPKVPVVEKRISICGDFVRRPGADADAVTKLDDRPAEVCGLVIDPRWPWEGGSREGGESILNFPMDIFFKNPHRLAFSFPSLPCRGRMVFFPSVNSPPLGNLGDVNVLSVMDDTRFDSGEFEASSSLPSQSDFVRAGLDPLLVLLPKADAAPKLANRFAVPGRWGAAGFTLSRFELESEVA